MNDGKGESEAPRPHKRRVRYKGTHPRRYEEKYKELNPELDPETVAKVIASGSTPAGQHLPIMVDEILEALSPCGGQRGADVTFGYGGHSQAFLDRLRPGGKLLALDVDAKQLPVTEARLRGLGYSEEELLVERSNYAGLASVLARLNWLEGVDFLLADLGLSSMQIDNPSRGFSYKVDGPLDMRMNPHRGISAKDMLKKCSVAKLEKILKEGGDEPYAFEIASVVVERFGDRDLDSTLEFRHLVESALPEGLEEDEIKTSVARVFQAVRIAVNEESSALNAFLSQLPSCLKPGGKVAVLTFHSGEDRRVKHHFRDGFRDGIYSEVTRDVIRASPKERALNPRASSAKLRVAVKSG